MDEPYPERPIDILLVEDNPGDARLTREAFNDGRIRNELHIVESGEAALDYLNQRGEFVGRPRPDLVLLDFLLPDMNGMELIETVRGTKDIETIPVIILTGSASEEDIVRGYGQGANAYMKKPPDPDDFVQKVREISKYWLQMVELPTTD